MVRRDADGEQVPRPIRHSLRFTKPKPKHAVILRYKPENGLGIIQIAGNHVVQHLSREQIRRLSNLSNVGNITRTCGPYRYSHLLSF